MFRWLNSAGSVFKDPLPGSTNYLSAYDSQGRLIRVKEAKRARDVTERMDEENRSEESANEPEIDGGRGNGREPKLNYHTVDAIPRETEEDMVPFPGNKQFQSQAVLSEDLKEVIWHLVIQKGMSVRRVSASYLVDMRRVAAVVRLKEVEKQWEREVSLPPAIVALA